MGLQSGDTEKLSFEGHDPLHGGHPGAENMKMSRTRSHRCSEQFVLRVAFYFCFSFYSIEDITSVC